MLRYRVERKKGDGTAVLSVGGHELSKGEDLDGLVGEAMALVEKSGVDGEIAVRVNGHRTRLLARSRFVLDRDCPPGETPLLVAGARLRDEAREVAAPGRRSGRVTRIRGRR